ncbi:MAG: DegT/DnrJ/EryC1/StrS family aminotransferase [Tannerella sp.]|jgi:dTDP-4-amino-4,6-dideoxygalactose transaminase|nr:DegT/DnrJ/EryC1/StrS family aminotransferase [Tannerella sp.]
MNDRDKPIHVMSPLLPPLDELTACLEEIWQERQVTNYGVYHHKLEEALKRYLQIPEISLFANGTLALICALRALDITGEVITTPYSFVATAHALNWCGIKPVFVDIDKETCTLDPKKIEAAITPATTAILPVHVYGNPCDTKAIEEIAKRYHLKVIYDAAHAFGVEQNQKSILDRGDASALSFHATKVFNTVEGGAVVCANPKLKKRLDYLKNFGFEDETNIVMPGINAKLDEVRAAYGWLNLKYVEVAIEIRKQVALRYREALQEVPGISFMDDIPGVKHNYAYFPIFIDATQYGLSRDELYRKMKEAAIFCRRYFYPLITECAAYRNSPSISPGNTPVAAKKAGSVLCLPMHHTLSEHDITRVLNIICKG